MTKQLRALVYGDWTAVPEKVLTNADLEKMVDAAMSGLPPVQGLRSGGLRPKVRPPAT